MTPRQRRLQTARDISLLLKQQWRPGLFALWLLIIDMIYWLFYFIEAKKLLSVGPNTLWFQQWVACLAEQAVVSVKAGRLSMTNPTADQFIAAGEHAQKTCAEIAAPFVPNFAWAALSDMMPALFGIVILSIFGSKMELWHDLRERLFGRRHADGGKIMMGDISKESRDKMYAKRPTSGAHVDTSSSSPADATYSSTAADTAPNHRQERYRRDLKVTTQRSNDGLYDEDLAHVDNPYGSQTNLTPTGVSFQKTNNGGPILKNQAEYNNNLTSANGGVYRTSTPEPWKPSAWTTNTSAASPSTDDYSIQTAYRSTSPQLRINTRSSPSQRPVGSGATLSPLSPQRQFYNSEDLDAIPTSLTTPPPTYNSNSSANVYRGPVSPRQNRRNSNSAYNSNQSVDTFVSDASRGRVEYNVEPRVQQYQQQQQPQSPTSPTRALSPPPSRPNKSMARNR
jgi:hypothetical protein